MSQGTTLPPVYQRYGKRYARTRILGRWIHLGVFDSRASHEKFRRLVTNWKTIECEPERPRLPPPTIHEATTAYQAAAGLAGEVISTSLAPESVGFVARTLIDKLGCLRITEVDAKAVQAFRVALRERGLRWREIREAMRLLSVIVAFARNGNSSKPPVGP